MFPLPFSSLQLQDMSFSKWHDLPCKSKRVYISCADAAAYDEEERLVGELGLSTSSVLMALPLPLHACWAHVCATAARLQHWALAKRAAAVLFAPFISSSIARPLWEAHPMDRHVLQMQQVRDAPGSLLRLLVQCLYIQSNHVGEQQQLLLLQKVATDGVSEHASSSGAPGGLQHTAASRAMMLGLNHSLIPYQVEMLEACKKILLAMKVHVHCFT
jgi:hypothetical protein